MVCVISNQTPAFMLRTLMRKRALYSTVQFITAKKDVHESSAWGHKGVLEI